MTQNINIALALYFAAAVLYIGDSLLFPKRESQKKVNCPLCIISTTLLFLGLIFNTIVITSRFRVAGRPPLANLYESLVFFAWCGALIYLFIEQRLKDRRLGALASFLIALSVLYATKLDPQIQPLMPALQSNWLAAHVITCFLGYAAFAISALASVMYICKLNFTKKSDEVLEVLSGKLIAFGFIFLTLGILSGAVWANEAWGTYWGWDPKETWSLITWLIYAAYLHGRFMKGWKGETLAWISVLGFAAVIFTYFGVSFLLSGLHSYAER